LVRKQGLTTEKQGEDDEPTEKINGAARGLCASTEV
jgi:hypothetical protein